MQQIWLGILAAILLLWSSPEAYASAPFGVITNIQGKVTILRATGTADAASNLALDPGDRLVTEKGASVRFLLGNELFFILSGNSGATIGDLSPFAQEPSPAVALEFGQLSAGLVQKTISSDSTQPVIFTPAALIIPGLATYDTVVGLDGTTAIAVSNGTVIAKQRSAVLSLARGQAATLTSDGTVTQSAPDFRSPEKVTAWLEVQSSKVHESTDTVLTHLQDLLQLSTSRFNQENDVIAVELRESDALLSEYVKAAKERSRSVATLERKVRIQEKKFAQRIKWYQEAVHLVTVSNALLHKMHSELGKSGVADQMIDINAARAKTDSLLDDYYARFAKTMPGERKIGSSYGRSMVIIPNNNDK